MQKQVERLHPSASCYMPQKHENDFQLMEQLGVNFRLTDKSRVVL
jgi:hypothetical protein